MLLKLGTSCATGEPAPKRSDVYTWNADAIDRMLAINIALGFTIRGMALSPPIFVTPA